MRGLVAEAKEEGRKKAEDAEKRMWTLVAEAREEGRKIVEEAGNIMRRLVAEAKEEGREKSEDAEKTMWTLVAEAREEGRKRVEEADNTMRRLVAEAQIVANAKIMDRIQRTNERVLKMEAAYLNNLNTHERRQDERIAIADRRANNAEIAADVRVAVEDLLAISTTLVNRQPPAPSPTLRLIKYAVFASSCPALEFLLSHCRFYYQQPQ